MFTPYIILTVKVFPVFKPNDYFFKHHWSESSGEQKWELFARVIRSEIMAPAFNFKLFEMNQQDKMEFKKIMKGKEFKD